MINDYWNPTDEELQVLIDGCLPLDDNFGDRVFNLLESDNGYAMLNVLYCIQLRLGYPPPSELFEQMVNWYASSMEYYED